MLHSFKRLARGIPAFTHAVMTEMLLIVVAVFSEGSAKIKIPVHVAMAGKEFFDVPAAAAVENFSNTDPASQSLLR